MAYVLAYGLRAGDQIELAIRSPDDALVSEAGFDVDQDAPRATRSAGRRAPLDGWAPGQYRVEAGVQRGEHRFTRTATFEVAQ